MIRTLVFAGAVLAGGTAAASEICLICDRQVVLDSRLAGCFIERFSVLANQDRPVVVVDLSDCPGADERDRGVVEALSMPEGAPLEPSLRFMLSRVQLACLRQMLDDGTIPLDPAARIALDECK